MSNCSGSCSSCEDGNCSNRLPPGMLSRYDLEQDVSDDILVYIESDCKGNIHPSVFGLLGKAREISSGRVFGVMFAGAEGREKYDTLFSYGVDTLYHMRNPAVKDFQPVTFAMAIADLSQRITPASILFSATPCGRELAPLVAAEMDTGLTADCTRISAEGRKLIMVRPALGGNIEATIGTDRFPQMATVRPGTFPDPVPEEGRKGTAISRPYSIVRPKEILSLDQPPKGEDIGSARILISLGNGIRKRSSVDAAYRLAEKIGASVSCSRAMADRGWMPRSAQVGQSGRTVSPDVYIAFGISGSVQHMAGVRAKRIISVNRDRNAPINSSADTAVIGDADSILESMLRHS